MQSFDQLLVIREDERAGIQLNSYQMQLPKKLIKTFLLEKDTHLSNLYILFFSLQSQQEDLLHQLIYQTQPILNFTQSVSQNIIDLHW